MKAFIAGIITFSLLISAVIANAFLIINKTDELLFELDALSDDATVADVSTFIKKWESSRLWIALTVHRENVDNIDDTLDQLILFRKIGNSEGYLSAKKKLHCTVERLRKTESFSLSRIF